MRKLVGVQHLGVGSDIDLDGNGVPDSFGLCRTEEGVRLDIWSDRLGGERLWSALDARPG